MNKSNKSKPDTSLVVGLTGGIGAGKSLALREFSRLGALAVCLDDISHELSRRGGRAYRGIVRAFGRGILGPDGEIDRGRLGERVFSRPAERRRLERLTHPLILREMARRIGRARGRVVVVDVPLLFEKGLGSRFDLTVLVASSAAARRTRVARRDGLSGPQVRRRLAAQMPPADKARRADLVIANDGSRPIFKRKLRQYYQAFALIQHGGR